MPKEKIYIVDGKEFKGAKAVANYYNLTIRQVYNKLGKTLKTTTKEKGKHITFEGVEYQSYSALAKAFGVKQTLIGKYINQPDKLYNYLYKIGNYKKSEDMTGKTIGQYKIVECIKKTNNCHSIYRFVCMECGHERITTLANLKQHFGCGGCNRIKAAKAKFERLKNTIIKTYKVIDYEYGKNTYKFLLECIHCGRKLWVSNGVINAQLPNCPCQKDIKRQNRALHDNEIIGDWKLENTNKKAYNTRNRLYKYTCIHCGRVKYDQYSKIVANQPCGCQINKADVKLKKLKDKYLNKIFGQFKLIDIKYKDENKTKIQYILQCMECGYIKIQKSLSFLIKPSSRCKGCNPVIKYIPKIKVKKVKIKKETLRRSRKGLFLFHIDNKIYTREIDIMNDYGISRATVKKFIATKDYEGLRLYLAYRIHMQNKNKKETCNE